MTHQHAEVSGDGQSIQAGRDVHIHHGDGVRRVATPATTGECPYPGLAAFTTEQSGWFFGRDTLTAHLVGRLSERLTEGKAVLVVGPSGAGKSSLLRAGLLAAIADRGALPVSGSQSWPQVVLTPTAQPLARLAEVALSGPRVVIVDQLEELFTLCGDEVARHRFLDTLTELAAGGAAVVYGLRIDAYAHCLDHPALREAAQHGQVVVGAMTEPELRQAVVYPSREAGLDLEPGLVDVLLRDLGVTEDGYEAGRLPLLAHALRALWRERHGHLLTLAGYHTTGGITDAVATTAELAYNHLDESDRGTARALFLRLVRIGDDPTDDTRRAVPCAELPDSGDVLDVFVAARLLTRDANRVTITHEVLLRAWPRLRRWLDDDRTANLTRQQLEDAATAWAHDDRDPSLLFRGNRLDSARTWHRTTSDNLTPTGTAFYMASIRQDTRARRRRRVLIALLAVLTLVATVTAGIAFDQRRRAESALKQVVAIQLVDEARRLRNAGAPDNHTLATQLDLVAWQFRQETGTHDSSVDTALITDAVAEVPVSAEDPLPEGGDVFELEFSPDRRTLALAASEGARLVRFWHVADWRHARQLPGAIQVGDAKVTAIRFSPNGRLLAVSASDGTVQLWRMRWPQQPRYLATIDDSGDRTELIPLQQPPSLLQDYSDQLATFVDDSILAVGHHATTQQNVDVSTARLWRVSDPGKPAEIGAPLTYLGRNTGLVDVNTRRRVVVTSYDQDWFDTGSDRTLVWSVTNPVRPTVEGILNLHAPSALTKWVSIHRDGRILAAPADLGATLDLWDITRRPHPIRVGSLPVTEDQSSVRTIAHSAAGNSMASYYRGDATIQLWRTTDPTDIRPIGQPLAVYKDSIQTVAHSPTGRLLASLSFGKYVPDQPPVHVLRLWNLTTKDNLRYLCATTPRITEEQWRKYVPNLDYDPPCS